jgi:regulator of cell morphogenesis and NO signaling
MKTLNVKERTEDMEPPRRKTVGEMVTTDHRAAAVFEKYSIDFCCNGGKTLDVACGERGVDPETIVQELQELDKAGDLKNFRPDEWGLDVLSDFIVNNHHRYVRRTLPVILTHVDKVLSVHGKNHPELAGIADRFHAVGEELTHHTQKEELVLFPYIKAMVAAEVARTLLNAPPFGTIANPIRMMKAEHQSAGDAFSFIRKASADFALPADACTTYMVTYKELAEFERDLHQHIHLENNILFPKAVTLESVTREGRID